MQYSRRFVLKKFASGGALFGAALPYCIYPWKAGIPRYRGTYNKTETVVVYIAKVKSHGGAVAAHCGVHVTK